MTERELMAKWRDLAADRDHYNAQLADNRKAMDAVENELADILRASDRWHAGTATKSEGLTATVREKWRAKYDPEKWRDLLTWAGATGNVAVVQRRLGDKAVMELVDAGVVLPEGLSVEAYSELEFRRS
jgi:hypothetical protein